MTYGEWLMRNSSEYVAVINSQVPTFNNLVISNGLRALSDGVVAFVVLMFLAYTDWRAFLIIGVIIGGTALIYDMVIKGPMKRIGKRQRELVITLTTSVRHAMEGLKELRVLGVEGYFKQRLNTEAVEWANGYAKSQTVGRMPRYIAEFSLVMFIVLFVNLVVWSEGGAQHLAASLGVFALGSMRLIPAVSSMMAFMSQLRVQRELVRHLARDWRNVEGSCDEVVKAACSENNKFLALEVRGLRFKYNNSNEYAVDDVDLMVKAGEAIALIGPSGSGKTTLVDVILGLLVAEQGAVYINSKKINKRSRELLDFVAYLPQNLFLMDDTLKRNIAIGVTDAEIDENRVKDAIRKAQLTELIDQLPAGLETVTGDRGVRLSGGQRQRVSLARAFYHNKSIIILDEATSALDNDTEKEIVREINMLKGTVTLIVIAHRLSTVKECDRIYRLEHGKVVESGDYYSVVK